MWVTIIVSFEEKIITVNIVFTLDSIIIKDNYLMI